MSSSKSEREGLKGLPGTPRWVVSPWVHFMNKVLRKLGSPVDLRSRFDHQEDMVSLEQIANFELLVVGLLERKVPGAFVELGCYIGSTTAVIASLLKTNEPGRVFHVYDRFDIELGTITGVRHHFLENMRRAQVPMPEIHDGDLLRTIPAQLPEPIAFVHIDLGPGGDVFQHTELITHALTAVYPRLAHGGVAILMDYHVEGVTLHGNDSNPGVRLATDAFLEGKPEKIKLLYGGPCSHAYFRKQ